MIGWAVLGVLASAGAAAAMQEAAPAEPEVVTVAAPVSTLAPGSPAQERFRAALGLLEAGNAGQARVELIAYQKEQPRSGVASDLLRQIEADALEYFPSEYREIALASGESLSMLAQRYLGDMYQFHALAKYNGIAEPWRLRAGQILRIPLTDTAIAAFAVDEDPDTTAREVAARTGEAAAAEPPATGNPAELHREALNALRAHDLEKAIGLWGRVLAVDPEHDNAALYRAQAVALQHRLRQLN
ncbi:MAG: LysM peptidoglycan-binding domain-containing protein [Haliea sp.]